MSWKTTEGGTALRGLDAVFTDEFLVTGYDGAGLWLVRSGKREQIVAGTADHTRDGSQFFGATALAADGNHVAYDLGRYPDGEIGLATRRGTSWTAETLIAQPAAIGSTSDRHIAIATANGAVTVAADVLGKDRRVLTILRPGEKPHSLGLEADGVALACDAGGDVHLLCNPREGGLRYGRASTKWKLEEIAGTSSAPHLSIAIDRAGVPHIAFLSSNGKNALFHGVRGEAGWQLTKVDRELNSGRNPRIAFDADNRPRIGHWASHSPHNRSQRITDTPVRFVKQEANGKWTAETVGMAFKHSAFALAPDGTPWFAFTADRKPLVIAKGEVGSTPAPTKKPPAKKK